MIIVVLQGKRNSSPSHARNNRTPDPRPVLPEPLPQRMQGREEQFSDWVSILSQSSIYHLHIRCTQDMH